MIETPSKNIYMFKLIIKLIFDLIGPVNLKKSLVKKIGPSVITDICKKENKIMNKLKIQQVCSKLSADRKANLVQNRFHVWRWSKKGQKWPPLVSKNTAVKRVAKIQKNIPSTYLFVSPKILKSNPFRLYF